MMEAGVGVISFEEGRGDPEDGKCMETDPPLRTPWF